MSIADSIFDTVEPLNSIEPNPMLNLFTKTPKSSSKKERVRQLQASDPKFSGFDMDGDAVDLRTMADNYPNGIIPLEDIHLTILAVLGPNFEPTSFDFDPSDGAEVTIGTGTTQNPKFTYISWDQGYLWPIFQRDVAPNHTQKIYYDFDPTCVIVPCAIKFTIEGKEYYCIWDGHHTIQVCRLKGYNKFPVWYIDTDVIDDETIKRAGFDPTTERVKYGCWLAGSNMIRINSKNKRKLSPYDEFMIKLETEDKDAVDLNNILRKNKCQPRRNAKFAGDFTQIKSGEECYNLANSYGNNKGSYLDRALAFHTRVWPGACIELEVFRPLAYLYYEADKTGLVLDQQFDIDLGNLFVSKFGTPEATQTAIKESYHHAVNNALGRRGSVICDHDKDRVLSGIINLYNQTVKGTMLPPAQYVWNMV